MQTQPTHWTHDIVEQLNKWGQALGFSQIGIADVDLSHAEAGLSAWLEAGFNASMHYMAKHGLMRARPHELVPGTVRVITARMNYLPSLGEPPNADWRSVAWAQMDGAGQAYLSRYALGRDYHKVLRSRLQRLADQLQAHVGPMGNRVFTDSAPVLEAELATQSGQGWRGKHTLVLSREAGSMFFLGEIFIDAALPLTPPVSDHCGQCTACLDVCPTQAIVAPYKLDARKCISYLTIEHEGVIDEPLRRAMGNRIYGCDDCQLICPWNKYAQLASVPDFDARPELAASDLLQLWAWDEPTFLRKTEGSAIRRIGHARWLRNVATAMGNALAQPSTDRDTAAALLVGLRQHTNHPHAAVREHVAWALKQYA